MTALYTILQPSEFLTDAAQFAVVADDHAAHYVFPAGIDGSALGLDDARIADVAEVTGFTPGNAAEWLGLATYNIGYYLAGPPSEAPDLDAATNAATAALAQAPAPTTSGPDPWAIPQTREERVAYQRDAMDEWAQQYPEAAEGSVDDPEADLALRQLTTPPVDPTKPHEWLPIATTETECGFCDQLENAAIHQARADTITSGSN